MAEMALGYGSENQLLRFLGHHRNELEQYILKHTKINDHLEYSLEWLDYPKDNNIKCSLLNIYFINGWAKNSENNVLTIDTWKEKINEEYKYLGINNNAKKYISEIFVEC